MKYILTPNPDPPYNLRKTCPLNDSPDFLDWLIANYIESGFFNSELPILIVDESELPNDDFFDAWEATGTTIQVNMTKARVIHLAEIRRVRDAELVKKDVPFMRAVEAGDTDAQATIATAKQVLRDIPATFNITTGVTTPAQLKAKWPAELPARE